MDLGSLTAVFGVDMSGMNQAQAGLQQFDSQAQSTFSAASGHVQNFGGQLMALVGISLSVGAALATIKTTIESISDTNLKAIAGAAMMVSKGAIEGINEQKQAYDQYYTYMKQMYAELNKETLNHFASGKEMIMAHNALVQQGIYATQDEAKSIGIITDAVKLLHAGQVNEGTMMHEIMGLTQGHASIRFKLALQLKNILGETWKEQVQSHLKEGDFITWLGEQYKGLAVAQDDIQNNLTAQMTTYSTIMGQIGKAGLGGLYEDIVGFVKLMNQNLEENKTNIITGIAKGWQVIHDTIESISTSSLIASHGELLKIILELGVAYKALALFGVISWVGGIGQAIVQYRALYTSLRAVTMINVAGYAMTSAAGMGAMAASAEVLAVALAPLAPIVLAFAAAFAIYGAAKGMTLAAKETAAPGQTGLGPIHTAMLVLPEAGGAEATIESAQRVADAQQAVVPAIEAQSKAVDKVSLSIQEMEVDLKRASNFITDDPNWYLRVQTEESEQKVSWLHDKIMELVNLLSRPYNFIVNTIFSGGSSGTVPAMPWQNAAGKSKADFGGQYPVGAGIPYKPMPNYYERLKLSGGKTGEEKYFTPGPTGEYMYQTTPIAPPKSNPMLAGQKGGGGKGAEGAEKAMAGYIESMNQEVAKAAGDSEAILGAWYGKQLQKIAEWQKAGLDTTEALEAADDAYYSKLNKLNNDFTDWYIAGMGKTEEALYIAEEKKLKEVAGNAAKIAKVQEKFSNDWRKHQEDQQQEATNLYKGYLDTMAQTSPLLSDQLGYKREALEFELQMARQALDKQLREEKITQSTYDEAVAMQAVVAQAKKYSLEREGWAKEGPSGGLKIWAAERQKEMETRGSQQMIDAIKSAESFMGDTIGSSLLDSIHGKQGTLQQLFTNIFDNAFKYAWKTGTTYLFDAIAGSIGLPGMSKPDGSALKPFHVIQVSAGIPGVPGSSLLGGLFGSGKGGQQGGLGGILGGLFGGGGKQQGEDPFNTAGLTKYATTGMTMSKELEAGWAASQQAMTAATQAGEASRIAAESSAGSQSLGLLGSLLNLKVLKLAGKAAAGAFSGVMEAIPPPFSWVLAPLAAAAAFAATIAFGDLGIGGGGGGSTGAAEGGGAAWGGQMGYALGGIVTQPTLAWVGEAGNDEAIIPLQGGRVPVQLSDKNKKETPHIYYNDNSTFHANDARGMKELLQEHRREIFQGMQEMIKDGHKL